MLRVLFSDQQTLSRVAPHLRAEGFQRPEVAMLVGHILEHQAKHGIGPTPIVALQMVRAVIEAGKEKLDTLQRCALCVEEAEELPAIDGGYVREVLLGEARKRVFWEALDGALKDFKFGRYAEMAERVQNAAQIGQVDMSPGTDFEQGLVERTRDRLSGKTPKRWGTGVTELDDMLRGGLAAGELGVIIGAPKSGKSMVLGQVALTAMGQGGGVIYYTFELSEREIANRIDGCISCIPTDQLVKKAEHVDTLVGDWLSGSCAEADKRGGLVIKQMPGYETTVRDLEAHLRQQKVEHSREPSVVIVDSADFMSSMRSTEAHWQELGNVYIELKGLATKWDVPVWTASWANKESLSKKIVSMGDIAESFKKVGIADLGVAICATEDERQAKMARLYVAFCRFAASGMLVGPLRTAFEYGMFSSGKEVDE